MRKIILAFAILCIAGCKHEASLANSNSGSNSDSAPHLKAMLKRTDVILVKHFYGEKSEAEDQNPKYPDIFPGTFTLEPVFLHEPGKEKAGLKGAIVRLRQSYYFSNGIMRGGETSEATLDFDELRDMDNALSAIQRSDAPWHYSSSSEHIEMQFSAKDDFNISAFRRERENDEVLYIKAGAFGVPINFTKAADLQAKIHSAVTLLESKS